MEPFSWLLGILLWLSPPDKAARQAENFHYVESASERALRYEGIARDAYVVAYDPVERPLFAGPNGRAMTAAMLLAVSWHESDFAKDVDVGPCYRGKDGKGLRCDSGASACMMQIKVGAGSTREGWSREDLFADRQKCFRAGLHKLRVGACKGSPDGRWAAYAGSCTTSVSFKRSREIADAARKILGHGPVPGPDVTFLRVVPSVPGSEGGKGAKELSLQDR